MIEVSELIVVEGKADASNLSRICKANFVITNGSHLSKDTLAEIKLAADSVGVIVFTDPDGPGEAIRRRISAEVKSGISHAYISKSEARRGADIGVENASSEALIAALTSLKLASKSGRDIVFCYDDLLTWGLVGSEGSKSRRNSLSSKLRLGECNAKSLLKKLNSYGITHSEVETALGIETKEKT